MQRILVVFNPRSSRFRDVEAEVLTPLRQRKNQILGKYEVKNTNIDDNVVRFSRVVRDDDLVLAVGGDATAVIAANGILRSGRDAKLAVLPYGNFNDLARTLRTQKLEEVLDGKTRKLWPLEIVIDGRHFRYATCYVTIGMTAESVELFDGKKVRLRLQKGSKSSWRSYIDLAKWYFRNRHRKCFLPEFRLNGKLMDKKTSDYAAVNGRSMARVMKGGEYFLDKRQFLSETGKLTNLWNLSKLMFRSILVGVPGQMTDGDILEFVEPATMELQAEGEYKVFEGVKKIEIRKVEKCLMTIQK